MTRIAGRLTLGADCIERAVYVGRALAGSVKPQKPGKGWIALDSEDRVLGVFVDEDQGVRALLHHFAEIENGEGAP